MFLVPHATLLGFIGALPCLHAKAQCPSGLSVMTVGRDWPHVLTAVGSHSTEATLPPRATRAIEAGALTLPPNESAEWHVNHASLAHDGGDIVEGARDAPRQGELEWVLRAARAEEVSAATPILIAMIMMLLMIDVVIMMGIVVMVIAGPPSTSLKRE